MRQDYFNIYGTSTDGIHFKVIATNFAFPENRAKGTIAYDSNNSSVIIILDQNPGTGNSFDMTKKSEYSIFKIKTSEPILGMGYIRYPKT